MFFKSVPWDLVCSTQQGFPMTHCHIERKSHSNLIQKFKHDGNTTEKVYHCGFHECYI